MGNVIGTGNVGYFHMIASEHLARLINELIFFEVIS
jgi:hypothetical protein